MVRKYQKSVQGGISWDNLATKRVRMFSRCVHEYIISYKLTIHKQKFADLDIDLFDNNSVHIIYITIKYFNMHRCALDFVIPSLGVLIIKKQRMK